MSCVKVTTSDYLNSSSSLRDRRARIVVVQFRLGSLQLDQHARDKFIRLLGDRSVNSRDAPDTQLDGYPAGQSGLF
jgi:hypothetical protein